MSHRFFILFAALAIGTAVSAQTAKTPAATAKKWIAPRTPWGDPDLQGSFTNLQEDGTPLERPDQFAGRSLDDIKGEELAAIKRDVQKRTITTFQGPLHAPENWWQNDLHLDQGSQACFLRRIRREETPQAGRPRH
jgi:hypothetical protein